jgi:hypothetical protein
MQSEPPDAGTTGQCEYDSRKDVVIVKDSGRPAVLDSTVRPLATKKKDIEKGEDQKDFWI